MLIPAGCSLDFSGIIHVFILILFIVVGLLIFDHAYTQGLHIGEMPAFKKFLRIILMCDCDRGA